MFNFLHKKNKTVPMSRMSRWFTSKLVHEIYKGINYFNNLLFFFILTEVCWLFLLKFIIQIFLSAIELFSCNVVSLDFFLFFFFFLQIAIVVQSSNVHKIQMQIVNA